jgi:hypothetical protein
LTTRCIRNVWRGKFSKVVAFFKVKYVLDLVQQGDLGGNVSVKFYFSKFGDSISSKHFVASVKFSILNFAKIFAIGTQHYTFRSP